MKKEVWYSIAIILLFLIIVAILGHHSVSQQEFISPIPKASAYYPTPTPIVVLVYDEQSGDPIIDEISRVFKDEGTKVVAKAIMCFYSESKLNTNAYNFNTNGTDDMGIAQINSIHGMSIEDRRNYKKNIKKAYELYKKYGFKPWYGSGCK